MGEFFISDGCQLRSRQTMFIQASERQCFYEYVTSLPQNATEKVRFVKTFKI